MSTHMPVLMPVSTSLMHGSTHGCTHIYTHVYTHVDTQACRKNLKATGTHCDCNTQQWIVLDVMKQFQLVSDVKAVRLVTDQCWCQVGIHLCVQLLVPSCVTRVHAMKALVEMALQSIGVYL